jgi:hypothetical protein
MPGLLDWITIAIILVVVAVNVYFLLWLAGLPGRLARDRQHPQAEAINVLGWLSLLTFFATWPIALVWAYVRRVRIDVADAAASNKI